MNLELYHSLRSGHLGLLPLPSRTLWKLTGNDRVRYLNGQVTNDVKKLQPGDSIYAAVPNPKGRMVGDVFISATAEALWLDAPMELRETLEARLQKYLIADDAELAEVQERALYHVFTPLQSAGLPSSPEMMWFKNARFGLPGYDVWIPLGDGFDLAGAEPVTPDIAETLRLEHGIARWGADMNEETLPPEAGLDRRGISYTKGCYLGQETIARIKSIGHVNKNLVVLRAESVEPPVPGTDLTAEGKPVGRITSSGFSPALEKGIALGYVQRQHAHIGERLATGAGAVTIIEPPLQLS